MFLLFGEYTRRYQNRIAIRACSLVFRRERYQSLDTLRHAKARMSSSSSSSSLSSSSSPIFSLTLDLQPVDDAKFLHVTGRVKDTLLVLLVGLSGDYTKTPSTGDKINNSFYARMTSRECGMFAR
jgi:hypothetical protein